MIRVASNNEAGEKGVPSTPEGKREHKHLPVGPVTRFVFVAGRDVSCAGLVGIPVRVRVIAAVPALGARERGEVTPGVDDYRCPLGRGAHVDIREVGALSWKQRGILERHPRI